jgi:hypothetical protein
MTSPFYKTALGRTSAELAGIAVNAGAANVAGDYQPVQPGPRTT